MSVGTFGTIYIYVLVVHISLINQKGICAYNFYMDFTNVFLRTHDSISFLKKVLLGIEQFFQFSIKKFLKTNLLIFLRAYINQTIFIYLLVCTQIKLLTGSKLSKDVKYHLCSFV